MKIAIKDSAAFNVILIHKGFTQRSFSIQAGISHSMISQIAKGLRNPSPRTAKRICEVLEVQFDDIFEIKDVKPLKKVTGC